MKLTINASETIANYILSNDKELNDYQRHCEENDVRPFLLSEKKIPEHVYEYAAYCLVFEYGYDLEGWQIISSKSWDRIITGVKL